MTTFPSKIISHAEFIDLLKEQFPEIVFEEWSDDLHYCEMGAVLEITEKAIDAGNEDLVRQHFEFVEMLWNKADAKLKNEIAVLYLEDLARGEYTPERRLIIHRTMSAKLLALFLSNAKGNSKAPWA